MSREGVTEASKLGMAGWLAHRQSAEAISLIGFIDEYGVRRDDDVQKRGERGMGGLRLHKNMKGVKAPKLHKQSRGSVPRRDQGCHPGVAPDVARVLIADRAKRHGRTGPSASCMHQRLSPCAGSTVNITLCVFGGIPGVHPQPFTISSRHVLAAAKTCMDGNRLDAAVQLRLPWDFVQTKLHGSGTFVPSHLSACKPARRRSGPWLQVLPALSARKTLAKPNDHGIG